MTMMIARAVHATHETMMMRRVVETRTIMMTRQDGAAESRIAVV